MQNSANVSLSAFEQQLVTDANFILTKNTIIKKVYLLFGMVSQLYQQNSLLQTLPEEVLVQAPKISKGENYEGLPYVMLDYPRCFGKEHVFAIRTFFWWGHFFSSTLQLKGKYAQIYQSVLLEKMKSGEMNGLWINTSEDEWVHHYRENQIQITKQESAIDFNKKNLIKISTKINLEQWDHAEEFLQESFTQYLMLLQLTTNPVK